MGTSSVPAYAWHGPSSKNNSASRIDRHISIASGRTGPHAATTTADTDLFDAWSPLTHEGFLTLLPVCQILHDKSRYREGLACMGMADGALVIVIEWTRGT